MSGEKQNNLGQFGFQEGTSALDALVLALAHLRIPEIRTVAVDQASAYDSIRKQYLMTLVDRQHTPRTAVLIALMIQPATVYTQGDASNTRRSLDVGLAHGGTESPCLYNIIADDLLDAIERALADCLLKRDPSPAKAFAHDLLLQLRTLLSTKRALNACAWWEQRRGQRFNMNKGKSASLVQLGDPQDLGLTVNSKRILPATSFEDSGVTVSATGPTDDSLRRRIAAAYSPPPQLCIQCGSCTYLCVVWISAMPG